MATFPPSSLREVPTSGQGPRALASGFGRWRARAALAAWLARARQEGGALAALVIAAGGLFAFVKLAGEIAEGDTRAFDRALLLRLRNPADSADPIGPPWLEIAVRDITSLGGHTVLTLVAVAAVGFLLVIRKRGAALLVAVAIGGGTLLSSLLKLNFARPRPDLVAHLAQVQTASFPSGHAMLSAVTYLTLGALLARVQARWRVKAYLLALAALLTVLIGCSRVYLGVHWPTDVLAGWCVGATWALLCWRAALWLQLHGEVEGDAPEGGGNAASTPVGRGAPGGNPAA